MLLLSASRIKLFKACRRAYELKYVYGLEPVRTPDALETGLGYHRRLEKLYGEGLDMDDLSKENAMAVAYAKHVLPYIPRLDVVEGWVEKERRTFILRGRVDGIADDGTIVEHKTTSLSPGEYLFNLQWDEQALTYMFLTGKRTVRYTICRKPSIRQKRGETEKDFFHRMVGWYDEDTCQKIGIFDMRRSDEEIIDFAKGLYWLADEMQDEDCQYYRNTCHCMAWGRTCEYAPICLKYDPGQEEHVGFVRKEKE